MTNIIVLGGSGFLGSQIIKSLSKANIGTVTCGDIRLSENLDCKYLELNILDRDSLIKNLENFDVIINCVGQLTKPFNLCFELNSQGINNLASAISKLRSRFVHLSTVAVYGTASYCNENSLLHPETNYATAKAFAEYILQKKCNNKDLTILRLPNVYGRGQNQGVFAYILKSYFSDRILRFNNNGNLKRSFLHVKDFSNTLTEIVKNDKVNGIFNLGGNDTISISDLVDSFETRFNMKFEKEFEDILPWENIEYLDSSRLESAIKISSKWRLLDFFEMILKEKNF